eukprot:2591989-Pleurochrysis_carterae.AAC.1
MKCAVPDNDNTRALRVHGYIHTAWRAAKRARSEPLRIDDDVNVGVEDLSQAKQPRVARPFVF